MSSLGFSEIFVILVVALIVLGPEKLPGAARQAGKFVGDLKRFASDMQNQVDSAFKADQHKDRKEDDSEGDEPSKSEHPGTEGFELIDRYQPPAQASDGIPEDNSPGGSQDETGRSPRPERYPRDTPEQ